MDGSELKVLSYPRDLVWPEEASVLAALHPEIIQAPFRDPWFFSVTGLEPSDEARYRPWARPVSKRQTVVGLALTAALHACLGRGCVELMVPANSPVGAEQIKIAPGSSTSVPTGLVEDRLLQFVRSVDSASLASVLRSVANPASSTRDWLGELGLPGRLGTNETLTGACSLTAALLSVYLSADGHSVSPADPNTTLDGVLVVVDDAIVAATTRLR